MPEQLLLLTKTEERDFTAETDSTFETEQRLKWKKKKIKNAVPIHFFPKKSNIWWVEDFYYQYCSSSYPFIDS